MPDIKKDLGPLTYLDFMFHTNKEYLKEHTEERTVTSFSIGDGLIKLKLPLLMEVFGNLEGKHEKGRSVATLLQLEATGEAKEGRFLDVQLTALGVDYFVSLKGEEEKPTESMVLQTILNGMGFEFVPKVGHFRIDMLDVLSDIEGFECLNLEPSDFIFEIKEQHIVTGFSFKPVSADKEVRCEPILYKMSAELSRALNDLTDSRKEEF